IDSLHVSFQPGLNVLSGETGAGKSIIIDAVNLILGGRASADMIRTGEEDACVECLFDLSGAERVAERLGAAGIEAGTELHVKRTVSRSGRNRVYMNGGPSTLSFLSEISSLLVNIYGQHESQTLLRPENHLFLLDGYGRLEPLRERYRSLHGEYAATCEEILSLERDERDMFRRIDLLSFQAREIDEAALCPGEDQALGEERKRLINAERLIRASRGAYDVLYGGEGSLLGSLRRVMADLEETGKIDAEILPYAARIQEAYLQLEDAALSLRDYGMRLESDPDRLREVEDRIDLIRRLERKYAPTIEAILSFRDGVEVEMRKLTRRDETLGELRTKRDELEQSLRETGGELSRMRAEAALSLAQDMERELSELAMKNARFQVGFYPHGEPKAAGLERVEFLFAPNPGEAPKPLAKIASGGELSRLMLALKQILPESDVPTLIFDEVDAGIGGEVSATVGRKLKRVAGRQQVLCITHLPQVAACADHHYKVEKRTEAGRTRTSIETLFGGTRVHELARMLGGAKMSEKAIEHAREMLEDACRAAR
ncbi:MAG: DNA repair protein RecN, partial [Geobacteraceae bacterium]|nr:DNA repair protein RecN [Geobacteraceae bacterium]